MLQAQWISDSQTFLCCGPVASSAESARPLQLSFFERFMSMGGLNKTSQLQTHFGVIVSQD